LFILDEGFFEFERSLLLEIMLLELYWDYFPIDIGFFPIKPLILPIDPLLFSSEEFVGRWFLL
jgi:hypothetical protein